MPPVGFETMISAAERPQTYALDRAATGTGVLIIIPNQKSYIVRYMFQKIINNVHKNMA